MAAYIAEMRFSWRGLDECVASIGSIAQAANIACLDDMEIISTTDGFTADGLLISRIDWEIRGFEATATIRPTASMILFVAGLMAKLPSRASVEWAAGWPHVHCPPNGDRDDEIDPSPLVPDALVPA